LFPDAVPSSFDFSQIDEGFEPFDSILPETFDDRGSSDDWTYVDIDMFEATF
jgi:hypothetical protein